MKWYQAVGTAGKSLKYVHRVRAEAALGHKLPPEAIVHHADGSKRSDAALVILESNAEHRQLHARMRVQAVGGNPWTEKICSRCLRALPFSAFVKNGRPPMGLSCYCRPCHAARIAQAAQAAAAQQPTGEQ